MPTNRFFRPAVLALCLPALSSVVLAQSGFSVPYTISNISMLTAGQTTLDLYDFYEGENFSLLAGLGFCWKFRKADGTELTFAFSTANSTVELVSGTSQAAGNDVVDVLGADIGPDVECVTYWPPTTLPLGAYHLRISATVNTTQGFPSQTTIQTPTGRGADFNITRSIPLGCGPNMTPGTFDKITGPDAPNYSILAFQQPFGGENFVVDTSGVTKVELTVGYKDGSNGKGISNVKAQFLDNASGGNVGGEQSLDLSGGLVDFATSFSTKDIGLQVNGSYKIKLTYNIATGAQQTVTSEEFNIVTLNTNCTALALGASGGGGSQDGGSGGSNNNTGGGGGGSGGAMAFAGQGIFFNMVVAFAVILFGLVI